MDQGALVGERDIVCTEVFREDLREAPLFVMGKGEAEAVTDRRVEDGLSDDAKAIVKSSDVAITAMEDFDDATVLKQESQVGEGLGTFETQDRGSTAKDIEDIVQRLSMALISRRAIHLHLNQANVPVATEARTFEVHCEAKEGEVAEAVMKPLHGDGGVCVVGCRWCWTFRFDVPRLRCRTDMPEDHTGR